MRTLHFIYTVPRGSLIERAYDRLSSYGFLPYRYRNAGEGIRWGRPIRSPHSVSYNLLQALKKKYRVRYYSMYEHGVCDTKEGDIVLAQPAPVLPHVPPQEIDTKAVTYRTFTERKGITKIIIMPYSHDETYTRWWRDLVKEHGENCIFISGEPWFATWDQKSPFRDLPIQNKIRIDIGVDTKEYPLVKRSFNPIGKRGIFYIGHTGWYKNAPMLEAIARAMPDVRFGHVGGGHIEGFEKVAEFASLSRAFLTTLGERYDIFINVSTGDPNATTVVEMLSSGFPVACTPETGYEGPHYTMLKTDDVGYNVERLRELLAAPEDHLVQRAKEGRSYAAERFNWDRIAGDVVAFVERVS